MKSALTSFAALMSLICGTLDAAGTPARDCRLIVDAPSGKVIFKQGPCEVRQTPCSTFKIPLALMGFDARILKDEHTPAWDYLPEYNSNRKEEQTRTDPARWEKVSVVWYSQKLTTLLGKDAFQRYVDQFGYGNRDLSGDPGKDNGLTESWLISSLQISPEEQVAFLQRLLERKLAVSERAYELTENIIPQFPAGDGWTVTGKTGSGFQRKEDGTLDRKKHVGWFVGWATKGDRRVVFAELLLDETPHDDYGGPRCREALIQALPEIMQKESSQAGQQ